MSSFDPIQKSTQKENEFNNFPRASVQHRLGGYALELALMLTSVFTLFLGWIVWNLVMWGQGQTPSKQILKLRVYSLDTGKPASWGHMAVRQFLIPLAFSCVYIPFFVSAMAFSVDSPDIATGGVVLLGWLTVLALQITDAFWIIKGNDRQRLTDKWARTFVVNES